MTRYKPLTSEETERLAILIEETVEITSEFNRLSNDLIQTATKTLRHGYESCHPATNITNREALEIEIGHLLNAVSMMVYKGDLDLDKIIDSAKVKSETIVKYLHHQK